MTASHQRRETDRGAGEAGKPPALLGVARLAGTAGFDAERQLAVLRSALKIAVTAVSIVVLLFLVIWRNSRAVRKAAPHQTKAEVEIESLKQAEDVSSPS